MTNWDPSLGLTGLFLLNSTVKSPFCPVPVCGVGVRPCDDCPQGPPEKCLCVFLFIGFVSPPKMTDLELINQNCDFDYSTLVAQCSATPATVAATPPCSATPFQTQISVRHLPAQGGGGRCDTKIFRGCSATPVLDLQNAIKSRKSAATRVARHV